jgi:hypothetical protein
MIRFDVEERLEKVEAAIVRRETQLRPLRRERRVLQNLLRNPAPAGSAGKTRKDAHP